MSSAARRAFFLRAVFALQGRRARRQGMRGGQAGAVSFIQFFGSALQVTPHFHSLVPDGVFVPREGCVRFEALPPPTQGEGNLWDMTRLMALVLLTLSSVAFSQETEEDTPQAYACPLQGLKDGRLTIAPGGTVELFDGKRRLASAELPELDFNPSKGNVTCKETRISLASQMPFRATIVSTELTWKSGTLQAGETKTEDASAEALEKAEKALKAGNIEAAIEQLGNVFYPHQYYNESRMAARILQRAHEVATRCFKARDAAGAANVLQAAFEHFSSFAESPEEEPAVPATRLTAIRNDYGFFLAEAGRLPEAEKQLRQVVEAAPERAVARLNLADALWAQGKKEEAEAQYREYARRIPRTRWPETLLQRCPTCVARP
jgi:tetratricopeptide (TPR) repeat protein